MAPKAKIDKSQLRSKLWFANPDDHDMTALYIERYMNWGLTREELQSGKPIIGIAQSGSDPFPLQPPSSDPALTGCGKAFAKLAASPLNFRFTPFRKPGKRPTANLDRNLAYLGLVETLFRLSTRRCGADHWLRQNHASHADGCSHRQYPSHGLVGRTDAERLVQGPAHGDQEPSSGTPRKSCPRVISPTKNMPISLHRPPLPRGIATQWVPPRP